MTNADVIVIATPSSDAKHPSSTKPLNTSETKNTDSPIQLSNTEKVETKSPSPVVPPGVNRRTMILLTKKARQSAKRINMDRTAAASVPVEVAEKSPDPETYKKSLRPVKTDIHDGADILANGLVASVSDKGIPPKPDLNTAGDRVNLTMGPTNIKGVGDSNKSSAGLQLMDTKKNDLQKRGRAGRPLKRKHSMDIDSLDQKVTDTSCDVIDPSNDSLQEKFHKCVSIDDSRDMLLDSLSDDGSSSGDGSTDGQGESSRNGRYSIRGN